MPSMMERVRKNERKKGETGTCLAPPPKSEREKERISS
jgi:hypothetical protein